MLPGFTTYGTTEMDAVAKVQAHELCVLAERPGHGEAFPEFLAVSFVAA